MDREEVGEPSLPAVPGTAELPAELRDYPVQVGIQHQEEYSRFMPLIKWLLLFPHYVCLFFLGFGAIFVGIYAFFAVLVTARYPEGAFDYIAGLQRWGLRVAAYHSLMVDEYPPFTLDDVPDYPARFAIAYPEHVERWRPLVAWLLIFPYIFVAGVLAFAAGFLVLIGFFAILFTKSFPRGLFEFVEVALRWTYRANAYAYFLVTRYPPFALG